ncbi:MAG: hypothetical protein KME13_18500 [Myxacorys californica WJT36-NPBG1]|nr:hypothetical protein [Myxacorys californica WJT36-NPBG1]
MALLETNLGLPQRRHLLVRKSYLNSSNVRVYDDSLILPRPYIASVPVKLIGLPIGSITVSQADFQVEVSRSQLIDSYIKEDKSRIILYIDPPVVDSEIQYINLTTKTLSTGIKCSLIHVIDDDPTILKLILRREKDK